jgi:hypothetical protein
LALSTLQADSSTLPDSRLLDTQLLRSEWFRIFQSLQSYRQSFLLSRSLTNGVSLLLQKTQRLGSVLLRLEKILKVQPRLDEGHLLTAESRRVSNEPERTQLLVRPEGIRAEIRTQLVIDSADLSPTQECRGGRESAYTLLIQLRDITTLPTTTE